jgi:hypothetical protein
MLRHQTTSKTCLHSRGIFLEYVSSHTKKTETETNVLLSQDLSRSNEELKNNVSELNHKITALNEELKLEKEKNEILLNKISKLGNIMNMIKPHVEDIIIESFYKD